MRLFFSCSFLKGAQAGDILEIKSQCLKQGKTLAFADVDIFKKSDGSLIATGRQTKFISN
jgi:acyl-coenzyme A thioesterase 13